MPARFRPTFYWLLIPAFIGYLSLALACAETKAPWVDEGWIASAPGNWAQTGSFGTPALEPTGSWLNAELTGINDYTYWNLPGSLVVQGLWYKLLGLSVFSMRSLSILWGLVALAAWFVIVAKLSGSRVAGAITVALLAVDYTFLWAAADGRMDMMCAALGSAGLAAYLSLRERRWVLAIWAANICIALAVFTHPNGFEWLLLLAFLVFLDRRRVQVRDALALTPYLALALAWGAYILRRPDYFLAQLGANSAARSGARWAALVHPLQGVQLELARYLLHYGVRPAWGGPVPNFAMLIPFLYWLAILGAWCCAPFRQDRKLLTLLGINALQVVWMTWFEGLKLPNYLVHILPSDAAICGVWLWINLRQRRPYAFLSVVVTAALVSCQAGVLAFKFKENSYRNQYAPTVQFLRERLASRPGSIVADSYFGFDLGLHRVRDDARLGYYSGLRPDYFVKDRWYGFFWTDGFAPEEPEVLAYIRNQLSARYTLVFEKGPFYVYERRTGSR